MVPLHELGLVSGSTLTMLTRLPVDLEGWPLQTAQQRFSVDYHGDYPKWAQVLDQLPSLDNVAVDYADQVTVTGELPAGTEIDALEHALQGLHPWRKGPFHIAGVTIDTEWRSDWKWSRVAEALGDMSGQRVLDIGCGNGYFGWRMLNQGAREVIGIDPTLLFCMQHLAIQHFTEDARNWVLPLKVEELPATSQFDTVFSMGVIYHRRDPQAHVQQLAALTAPGGRVILESLVVDGDRALVPDARYARMRNVWCVPTTHDLEAWLRAEQFTDVTTLNVGVTSCEEQRTTPWMRFESLLDALDPSEPNKTIEGHPAPTRALVIARKPDFC
jgi:tRNA (mo5U34)-methyltransferase